MRLTLKDARVDRAAEALRQYEQGGKKLNAWDALPGATQNKWRRKAMTVIEAYQTTEGGGSMTSSTSITNGNEVGRPTGREDVAGSIYANFCNQHPKPIEFSLRVWWIPQLPGKPFYWPVPDARTAATVLDMLAAYDDFQFSQNVKGDYSNSGGLEVFMPDRGGWEEWEGAAGEGFDEYRQEVGF